MDQGIIEEVDAFTRTNGAASRRMTASATDTATSMLLLLVEAFSARFLVWVTTMSSAGAWWWVVLHPSTLGIVAAGCATMTVLVPVLLRDMKGG